MKIDIKYGGKWIATKGEKIIAYEKTLGGLEDKTKHRKDKNRLRFTLIPKGLIAG